MQSAYQSLTTSRHILLPDRLTCIDETNRADHPFLDETDRCFFFGEYFAHKGYQGSGTNQLIFNFKCKPSIAATNPGRGRWKERAVQEIAAGLRRVIGQQNVDRLTWVPIPPSKTVGHIDYDDRLIRTSVAAFHGYNADVRMLLRQSKSTKADHESGDRLTPEALYEVLELDRAVLSERPFRDGIVLFDDLLTTGKHFKCCTRRLREVVPASVPMIGVFVARRILPDPAADFEDLTSL